MTERPLQNKGKQEGYRLFCCLVVACYFFFPFAVLYFAMSMYQVFFFFYPFSLFSFVRLVIFVKLPDVVLILGAQVMASRMAAAGDFYNFAYFKYSLDYVYGL